MQDPPNAPREGLVVLLETFLSMAKRRRCCSTGRQHFQKQVTERGSQGEMYTK